MVKRIKYPIEAFALAMVLFSSGMKEAAVIGISLIFGDILLCVAHEKSSQTNASIRAGVCTAITAIAMMVMVKFTGGKIELPSMIRLVLVAILEFKHMKDNFEVKEFDFDDVLFTDTIAYAAMVVIAILREYASAGKIFGFALPKMWFVAPFWAYPMFALILGGVVIGLLNKYFQNESNKDADLWVTIPVILFEVPLVVSNVLETDGKILGMVMAAVLLFTYRKKVDALKMPAWMKGIPAQMILLGIIYAVLSLFR